MTFAEIILRIGGAIGGWLVFAGLCLVLAIVPQADCTPGSEQLWRGTLLFAGVSFLALIFVGRGLQWAPSLKWLTLPALALAALATVAVFPGLSTTTFGGASLCAITGAASSLDLGPEHPASTVERLWPVAQLGVLLFGAIQAGRYWRAPADSSAT